MHQNMGKKEILYCIFGKYPPKRSKKSCQKGKKVIKYTHREKTSDETGEPHSIVEVFKKHRFTLAPARL